MAWWIKKNLICTEQPSLLDIVWPEPSFKIFDTRHLSKKKKKEKKEEVDFFFFLSETTVFRKTLAFPPSHCHFERSTPRGSQSEVSSCSGCSV